MKYSSFTLSRAQNLGLRALLALIAFLAVGPIGLLAAALNPDGFGTPILGTSYTRINAGSKADATGQFANVQEQLWVQNILGDNSLMFQSNPFADGMSSNGSVSPDGRSIVAAKGSMLGRAILNIKQTMMVHGNTVNIPTRAGFAGPGVAGEGDCIGSEQKVRVSGFSIQVGQYWFGAGATTMSLDETLIGTWWDQGVAEDLRQQVAKKKSDDIMMKILQRSGSLTGTLSRNYILPSGIASRAALTTNNVFSTTQIVRVNQRLQSNGGTRMSIARDSGGSIASKYIILGPSDGMAPLNTETAYLEAVTNGDVRGEDNALFRGGLMSWGGVGLYSWEQLNHANYGPVGSPLMPRGFLGYAVTAANDAVIKFGGSNAAADWEAGTSKAPQYSQFFSNAPYTFTHGETISAVTNVDRYLRITNPDGSYAVVKFRLNDGNKITLHSSGAVLSIGTGTETTTLLAGALIEECNVLGTPFCRHIGLGQQAVVTGAGSLDGTNGAMGKRTKEERNHQSEYAVGIRYKWGCEAYKRVDGTYPGFLVTETALPTAA
jgi:hypothetical protein